MSRVARDERGFTLVELMVTITIMGLIMSAITGVAISTLRVEQDQQSMQETIDQGRVAISGLRRELRQARRVLPTSTDDTAPTDRLLFWVDEDQNGDPEGVERICYAVVPLPGGPSDRYQLVRWNGADAELECDVDQDPAASESRVLARTLTSDEVFVRVLPAPTDDPYARQTRQVDIELHLEVDGRGQEISTVPVDASIRLRNVP